MRTGATREFWMESLRVRVRNCESEIPPSGKKLTVTLILPTSGWERKSFFIDRKRQKSSME